MVQRAAPSDRPDLAAPPAAPENSSLVLERLRARLAAAAAGDRLPSERQLAEEIGVGRRSVRRALAVLEAEGLIWRRQGSGAYVGAPPPPPAADLLGRATTPAEVMEARLALEPTLARLAADRATPEDSLALRDLLARLDSAGDADGRELWDGALHRKIARCAGNAMLLGFFEIIDAARRDEEWRRRREAARSASTLARAAAQHAELVAAIEAGDRDRAEAAMRAHLDALAQALRSREDGDADAA